MKSNLFWLALGWAGFYASHSALAHSRVKALVAQWAGANYRFYRLGFNLFSTIFFIALVQWLFSLPAWPLVPETITQKLIGALVFLLGAGLGSLAFVAAKPALGGLWNWGACGVLELPTLLGAPRGLLVTIVIAVAIAVFIFVGRIERAKRPHAEGA